VSDQSETMTILIAIDLSSLSWKIIEMAKKMLNPSKNCHFWLIHIANPEPDDFVSFEPGPQEVRDAQASDLHQQHQMLQAYADRLRASDLTCTALQIQGAYADKILEEAEKLKADIIVIGSHGKGMVKQLIFGSTSNILIQHTHIPVLVIPTH
jgi:nucleotide-binding universal stress UspA family protein